MSIPLKGCLKVWWKGVGVLGAYFVYSIVAGGAGYLVAALPDDLMAPVGLPIYLIVVPPLLYVCHRMMWPDARP